MGRYAHPALAEREEIMLMRHEGRSPADIARATGRDRSTISREMRRNSFRVGAGPLLPGIDRATLLRGAQALLRASQDPRRRGARRARHAADRAGALVARADRRQDRGRTSGPVGVRVDHLPGRQRRQARLARAGARQTGHQGAPTPQGQAAVYFVKLRWTCSALNLDTVGVQLEHRRRLVPCFVVCLVYFMRECLFR